MGAAMNLFGLRRDGTEFSLKKVLPAGMTFPYDFGSFPRPWRRMAIRWTCCC